MAAQPPSTLGGPPTGSRALTVSRLAPSATSTPRRGSNGTTSTILPDTAGTTSTGRRSSRSTGLATTSGVRPSTTTGAGFVAGTTTRLGGCASSLNGAVDFHPLLPTTKPSLASTRRRGKKRWPCTRIMSALSSTGLASSPRTVVCTSTSSVTTSVTLVVAPSTGIHGWSCARPSASGGASGGSLLPILAARLPGAMSGRRTAPSLRCTRSARRTTRRR
mmetsp:Transcript_9886/g.15453  ORF Transcript_9886/g.15453 Transcript_9886/m.15453 type:complete len:219 (+) Transcript_9886:566-1222(+)